MENYSNILVSIDGGCGYITINRESKMNALNGATLQELSDALNKLEAAEDVKGLIITGEGQKAFVAGADIQEFVGLGGDEASALARRGHEMVMDRIQQYRKPVIAAINGFALGGGLELAMACHIRVASINAKLGLPEVSLGLIPGYGGTQRLTQLVGRGKAMEMILTGDMIDAEDAMSWGLVNHVVEQEELLSKAKAILDRIMQRSPNAVANAIEAVNKGLIFPQEGFGAEIKLFGQCFDSPESKEGVQAFLEKRKPNF